MVMCGQSAATQAGINKARLVFHILPFCLHIAGAFARLAVLLRVQPHERCSHHAAFVFVRSEGLSRDISFVLSFRCIYIYIR